MWWSEEGQRSEKEKKRKTNEQCDIKGRENAGSYDNYEQGRKEPSRCATAREMKSVRGTIVYKFDRWNFSFHPFLLLLSFFFLFSFFFFFCHETTDQPINGSSIIQLGYEPTGKNEQNTFVR